MGATRSTRPPRRRRSALPTTLQHSHSLGDLRPSTEQGRSAGSMEAEKTKRLGKQQLHIQTRFQSGLGLISSPPSSPKPLPYSPRSNPLYPQQRTRISPPNSPLLSPLSPANERRRMKGKDRSAALMNSLYGLRRAGDPRHHSGDTGQPDSAGDHEGHQDAGVPSSPKNSSDLHSEDGSLLIITLGSKSDTAETLRQQAKELQESQSLVQELGGPQHATSCVVQRALVCTLRKIELLEVLREKTEAFEVACGRQKVIIDAILGGQNANEAAPELMGLKRLLHRSVHSGGEPQDGDKSDFKAFAKSFGLPSEHQYVVYVRDLLKKKQDDWAEAATQAAEAEAASPITAGMSNMRELVTLLIGMGCSPRVPAVLGIIALWTLKRAQQEWAADEKASRAKKNTGNPMPSGLAYAAAKRILNEVKKAVEGGVHDSNPRLVEARNVAQSLMEEDGLRKRLEAAEKRKRDAAQRVP